MATRYLILTGKQAAKAQSADWWNKVLGRLKLAIDVTEFLVRVIPHPTTDTALVVVDDASYALVTPKMTANEKNNLDANLLPATDPAVVAFLAAVAA